MQYRRYIISSSFKMAVLFTLLLGISITASVYIFLHLDNIFYGKPSIKIAMLIAITAMIVVILMCFLISVFVVKTLNHIAKTAVSIMNTGDLTQRIQLDTNWDDLSNLAHVLNDLLKKVEQLMCDIKLVSDNIAHDLRTPLTRLHNNLQTLDQKFKNQETAQALQESQHLLAVFHALLRISHLEHSKQQLCRENVAIDKLIHDACALYEPIFDHHHIRLRLEIENATLFVDRDLIFQALVNVLDNCIKHASTSSAIDISGKKHLEKYIMSIKDQGEGIPQHLHQKIFERFYQHLSSRTDGGSGLGLSLVKAIIQRHNGDVMSKPNQPKGLVIDISLPLYNYHSTLSLQEDC
jgi:two-component system sensor kinase